MITKLYDIEDVLISDLVNSAILNLEVTHIKNKLLDGTYHVQTIGDSIDVIDVTVYVNQLNKTKIDYLYKTATPVKLVKEDKWYKGIISDLGSWEVFVKRQLYEGSFKLYVSESGDVE